MRVPLFSCLISLLQPLSSHPLPIQVPPPQKKEEEEGVFCLCKQIACPGCSCGLSLLFYFPWAPSICIANNSSSLNNVLDPKRTRQAGLLKWSAISLCLERRGRGVLSFPVSCTVAGDVPEREGGEREGAHSCVIIRDILHFIYFISLTWRPTTPPPQRELAVTVFWGRGMCVA